METTLNGALKKAKRKQLLKIILISITVVIILLPILYKTGNYFAAKSSTRLHERLFLHNAIAEPNIQIDSQVTSNSTMFGGEIVTNRSKNVNGYLVQWSTLTSSYDWVRYGIDYNELIPGLYWADSDLYAYDKQTKNKVAMFYHPDIEKYYDIENELAEIAQMENYVAEVAISFDQPYTFEEIKEKIPDNLNIVWLYMTSAIVDESNGPSNESVYGFALSDSSNDAFEEFMKAMEQYDEDGDNETIQKFLKANKNTSFEQAKVLGVMLTGRTENFKALADQQFIRGASVGATAQIVPYIQPEK